MKKANKHLRFPQLHWIATTSVASGIEQAATWGPPSQVSSISYPNAYYHVPKPDGKRQTFAAHITCHDGTKVSVQANYGAYCRPRDNEAPYTHFEVSVFEDYEVGLRWQRFYPEQGIYGYVPLAKVEQLIRQHGGEVNGPHIRLKLPRKLKKAVKTAVLAKRVLEDDYQSAPKSGDIVLLDAYNRTEHTHSPYRLGTAAGKLRWWSVYYRRLHTSNRR